MKKFILVLTLSILTSPAFCAVSNIADFPVVNVNGTALDKSMIMKASYNANTRQIIILYGNSSRNQVLCMPGTPQDVTAINAARASWKTFLANQEKRNQEELYQKQLEYGDEYVRLQKEMEAIRNSPTPKTSEENIAKIKKLNDLQSKQNAWCAHVKGYDVKDGTVDEYYKYYGNGDAQIQANQQNNSYNNVQQQTQVSKPTAVDNVNNAVNTANSIMNMVRGFSGY